MTIVSDVPKGTGLGSSSALSVTLAKLAHPTFIGEVLVRAAGRIERAHSHAGWQDYLPAVYGGFNTYHINGRMMDKSLGGISITPISTDMRDVINTYGLLLYTGASRRADAVLPAWKKDEGKLLEIKALADEVAERVNSLDLDELGNYLDCTWTLKRVIGDVSSPVLNRQYAMAKLNGAIGGKLLGAGSGGCWFFLVSRKARERLVDTLDLREIPFHVVEKGVEVWEL